MRKRVSQFMTWLRSGKTHKIYPEIDDIQSEVGGFAPITSTSQTELYNVPSGKRFSLEHMIIYNKEDTATTYIIYDSEDTTTPIMELRVAATTRTHFTDLEGIVFDTSMEVVASEGDDESEISVGGRLCNQ